MEAILIYIYLSWKTFQVSMFHFSKHVSEVLSQTNNIINAAFASTLHSLDFLPQSRIFKSKNKKERTIFKKVTCESYLKMDI